MRFSWLRLGLAAAILCGSSATTGTAHAGAWTREAGGWFLKLGYDRWFTGQRFDSTGARVPYRDRGPPAFVQEYRSQALRAYAEYGLTPEWTAIAGAGYEWLVSEGDGTRQRNSGLSDLRLQLKRRLFEYPVATSAVAEVKLPLAARSRGAPALGTDQVDFGGGLALGGAVGPLYATVETGYRVRGGVLADQVPFQAEAGWSSRDDVLLRAALRGTVNASRSRVPAGPFDPALAESRDLSASVGLVLRGQPLDLVLEAERVLDGRNALAGTRLAFSIWHTRPGRH